MLLDFNPTLLDFSSEMCADTQQRSGSWGNKSNLHKSTRWFASLVSNERGFSSRCSDKQRMEQRREAEQHYTSLVTSVWSRLDLWENKSTWSTPFDFGKFGGGFYLWNRMSKTLSFFSFLSLDAVKIPWNWSIKDSFVLRQIDKVREIAFF